MKFFAFHACSKHFSNPLFMDTYLCGTQSVAFETADVSPWLWLLQPADLADHTHFGRDVLALWGHQLRDTPRTCGYLRGMRRR